MADGTVKQEIKIYYKFIEEFKQSKKPKNG